MPKTPNFVGPSTGTIFMNFPYFVISAMLFYMYPATQGSLGPDPKLDTSWVDEVVVAWRAICML